MAQMQNMLDFPPAPKLTVTGHLDPAKATPSELRGEKLFFGKAQCAVCHPAPFYLDNQMHDLHVERFLKDEPATGRSRPSRCAASRTARRTCTTAALTLEDTVEFFNLVLELKLTNEEKTIWLSSCGSCRACGIRRRARRLHAYIVWSAAMIDQVMFHAAHGRGAARFSAACFFATLILVATAPFVSAQTNSCGGDNGGITLPPGFCATIFADNLGHARQMAFGPNGVLYLNTWSGGYYQNDKPPDGGFLVALKDTKGDGRADVIGAVRRRCRAGLSGRYGHSYL